MIESLPQSRNTIPGRVFMTVDFRHPDDDELTKMDAEMRAAAADIAKRHRLEVKIEQIWYFPPSPFARELRRGGAPRRPSRRAMPHMDIVSGAGHDACYVSRVAPTAMIFVPCKDGISHNEIEDANKADIGAGARSCCRRWSRGPMREVRVWSRPRPPRWSRRWRAWAGPCRSCWRRPQAVGATPEQASSWVSGLGHRHGAVGALS